MVYFFSRVQTYGLVGSFISTGILWRSISMGIKPLLMNSWKIICEDKWIWFSSLLVSLATFLSYLSSSMAKYLYCLSFPIELLALLGTLLGGIGIVYASYHIAKKEKVNLAGLWKAGKNTIVRVAAIILLAVVPFICIICLIITFSYDGSSKSIDYSNPVWIIAFFLFPLFVPLISLSYIGVIIDNLGIRKSIRKGFTVFVEYFGIYLIIFLVVCFIAVIINLASALISLFAKSNFNPSELSGLNYKSYWALTASPVFNIFQTIGVFLTQPFITTLYVLVYLKSSNGS
jgi:hypothetical protein